MPENALLEKTVFIDTSGLAVWNFQGEHEFQSGEWFGRLCVKVTTTDGVEVTPTRQDTFSRSFHFEKEGKVCGWLISARNMMPIQKKQSRAPGISKNHCIRSKCSRTRWSKWQRGRWQQEWQQIVITCESYRVKPKLTLNYIFLSFGAKINIQCTMSSRRQALIQKRRQERREKAREMESAYYSQRGCIERMQEVLKKGTWRSGNDRYGTWNAVESMRQAVKVLLDTSSNHPAAPSEEIMVQTLTDALRNPLEDFRRILQIATRAALHQAGMTAQDMTFPEDWPFNLMMIARVYENIFYKKRTKDCQSVAFVIIGRKLMKMETYDALRRVQRHESLLRQANKIKKRTEGQGAGESDDDQGQLAQPKPAVKPKPAVNREPAVRTACVLGEQGEESD